MKKILAFLLAVILVLSVGVTSFSALDADVNAGTQAGSSLDEVTPDESSKDEASKDEASKDEATFDEAHLRQLVLEFILNSVHVDIDLFADVEYSLDMIITHKSEATADYAVFDLNFVCNDEDEYCEIGTTAMKIGNSIYTNEINYRVSGYIGLGYFVVIPETEQVLLIEDALAGNFESLKELCREAGFGRIIGDANKDGKITIMDATYIQKLAAGFEGYENEQMYLDVCRGPLDFDGNYKVNIKDATNIQKYLADLPFIFCGSSCEIYTEVPKDAEKLECTADVIKNHSGFEKGFYTYITTTEEYAEVFFEESEVYNDVFFAENDLVVSSRIFGSGSMGYGFSGLYRLGDTLYLECRIFDIPPGFAGTCDVVEKVVVAQVSKELTQGVTEVFRYEDHIF